MKVDVEVEENRDGAMPVIYNGIKVVGKHR
jgi:hypothetical protein